MSRARDLSERFWEKVDKRGPEECWPWLARINSDGYGEFELNRRTLGARTTGAHRVAYALTVGEIPVGFHIDHVKARGCTRRDCVNPAHLEAVTPWENTQRTDNFIAIHARKTHCKHGHEFTVENTRIGLKRGKRERVCRACHRYNQRAYMIMKASR